MTFEVFKSQSTEHESGFVVKQPAPVQSGKLANSSRKEKTGQGGRVAMRVVWSPRVHVECAHINTHTYTRMRTCTRTHA